MEEKKYKLRNATPEEAKLFNDDFAKLVRSHNAELRTVPVFVPTTEGKFVVDAEVKIFKLVELVAKDELVDEPQKDVETKADGGAEKKRPAKA